jgi:hypothetical protein
MSQAAVQVKATLDITAESEDQLTEFCIRHLRDRGYGVRDPKDEHETPAQFMKRLGVMSHETINRALVQPDCPPVKVHRGRSGRLIWIRSNDDFDAFVRRNKA